MSLQTTTHELKTQLLNGWLGSLALHGLLLLSFLPLFRASLSTMPMEPFHWDVSLVQAPHTVDEPGHNTNATESAISKLRGRTPIPARAVRTAPHATSSERIMPIDSRVAESVAPISEASIASSEVSPKARGAALISDGPTLKQPQTNDPPLQQTDMPADSTTAELSTAQPAADSNEGAVRTLESLRPLPPTPAVSDTEATSTSRLDYGWLQKAIFRRLDTLKRSSRPSLDESRLLKVTIKAVVSRNGTLLDSAVVKSSGLDRIDQEAIALVPRAFPMQFDRTLDRQQIVMHIPITYSQE